MHAGDLMRHLKTHTGEKSNNDLGGGGWGIIGLLLPCYNRCLICSGENVNGALQCD